jgi:trehalose utilization protein
MKRFVILAAVVLSAATVFGAGTGKRVAVVWSEGTVKPEVFPHDINGAVADGLACLDGWEVVKGSINDPDQGLPDSLLNRCDVLVWWGHKKHGQVKDELVNKIVKRVKEDGMGFIALHSAHFAKPNIALMSQLPTAKELLDKVQPKGRVAAWGTYKGDSKTLAITVKDPSHPIAKGVKNFTIVHEERYSDPYAVPTPQSVVFEGDAKLKDGSIDHSQVGLCWQIGKGKMFYLQAGHESTPVYCDENIRKIMANAVLWAAPTKN